MTGIATQNRKPSRLGSFSACKAQMVRAFFVDEKFKHLGLNRSLPESTRNFYSDKSAEGPVYTPSVREDLRKAMGKDFLQGFV